VKSNERGDLGGSPEGESRGSIYGRTAEGNTEGHPNAACERGSCNFPPKGRSLQICVKGAVDKLKSRETLESVWRAGLRPKGTGGKVECWFGKKGTEAVRVLKKGRGKGVFYQSEAVTRRKRHHKEKKGRGKSTYAKTKVIHRSGETQY